VAQPLTPAGDVTTLGTWTARQTTIADVNRALTEIRRHEQRAAVRAAVMTLVVVTEDEPSATEALDVVHELSVRHPAHALVLLLDDGDEDRLDGEVRVHCIERGGRALSFEDVLLRVPRGAAEHLDSLVEPLTLADLPVVLWLPGRTPSLGDPLLGAADRLLVDSKVGGAQCLAEMAMLSSRLPVADLSWIRLRPWRQLLSGLFEGRIFRPFVAGVSTASVWGKPGPRHLLGGWLMTRLQLARSHLHLTDSRHAGMELVAEIQGTHGRFRVERTESDRLVHATAEVEGGPAHRRSLRLRHRSAAWVVGEALEVDGPDPVYEAALAAAVTLV
jgi:glucose-6-phosphate dehydrogenase assembly protein OpcA